MLLSSRRLGFLGTSTFSLNCSKVVPTLARASSIAIDTQKEGPDLGEQVVAGTLKLKDAATEAKKRRGAPFATDLRVGGMTK